MNHAETYLRFSRVPRNHGVLLWATRDGVQGELRSRALRLQAGSGAHLRLDQISVRVPLVTASAVAGTATPTGLSRSTTSSPVHHDHLWSYLSLHLSFKKYTYLLTIVLRCHASVGARLEAMCYVHRQPAQLQWRLLFNSASKLGRLTYRLDPLAKDRHTGCVTRRLT